MRKPRQRIFLLSVHFFLSAPPVRSNADKRSERVSDHEKPSINDGCGLASNSLNSPLKKSWLRNCNELLEVAASTPSNHQRRGPSSFTLYLFKEDI